MALPYPGMNFVPLDVLTAAEQNQLVANIEYLDGNIVANDTSYTTARRRIYIDGTSGDDGNDGLSTSAPKKTLASVMDVVNTLGGSADIRFMTAGNYDWVGGFLDGVNFIFEKNSSSIGDVTVSITVRTMTADNSFIQFSGINLRSTTSGVVEYTRRLTLVNSHIQLNDNSCRIGISMSGSSAYVQNVSFYNSILLQYNSAMNINNAAFEFEAPTSSNTTFVTINTQSKVGTAGTITINDSGYDNYVGLFSVGTGSHLNYGSTTALVDNTVTKYRRFITSERATVRISQTQLTAWETIASSASSLGNGTVTILGSATLGS